MDIRRTLTLRWKRPKSDRGISMIETVAALVFVSVLIAAIAAINPGNYFHDYIRGAVCLVGGPSCEGESWIELEDTDPPIKRPTTPAGLGGLPEGHVANEENRKTGMAMAAERGFDDAEQKCLDELWQRESGWDHTAQNPTSKATGIPQLLESAGHDLPAGWDDPKVQINWGLDYITERYGTPCEAWEFWQNPEDSPEGASTHWY